MKLKNMIALALIVLIIILISVFVPILIANTPAGWHAKFGVLFSQPHDNGTCSDFPNTEIAKNYRSLNINTTNPSPCTTSNMAARCDTPITSLVIYKSASPNIVQAAIDACTASNGKYYTFT